jgi:flavodoxin/ferredoxin
MKVILVYYSQSGNTKVIAEAIQRGISRQNQSCDLARLKEIQPSDLEKYDLIGIGSPIWSSEPTPNVLAFIKRIPAALEGRQAFFFCTHGTLPGQCILVGVKALRRQKLKVIGWLDTYASVNLAGHPKPYLTDGHPDAIDIAEAEAFGQTMVENSLKISAGAEDLIPILPEGKEYEAIYGLMYHGYQSADQSGKDPAKLPAPLRGDLRINPDKCIQCHLCADNCISENIDFTVNPPVFKTKYCERCLFCEAICPTGAIEYDFQPPECNYEAVRNFQKVVALAESKGRFRRLVRIEDIGWNTPWEKVTGHPRLRVP